MILDELQVGREMDKLIATEVMEFNLTEEGFIRLYDIKTNKPSGYVKEVPKYSTDIAAAFEVIEKIGELGFSIHIQWKNIDNSFFGIAEVAFIKDLYAKGFAMGTFPEAVCRAALMAVISMKERVKCAEGV